MVLLTHVEAAGERVIYAKAVSDYKNQYDQTCLNFKAGDSIAVSICVIPVVSFTPQIVSCYRPYMKEKQIL